MNICYENLTSIEEYINDKYGFSYKRLDEMDKHKTLDQLLDLYSIHKFFKDNLEFFLNILYTDTLNNHEYLRKIILYQSPYMKVYKKYGYITSLFLKNKEAYRVFPLYVKSSIDKYKLEEYKDLTLEEIANILNKYIDLDYRYEYRLDKEIIDVVPKIEGLYTNYEEYDSKLNTNSIDFNNQTEFFVWSEYNALIQERQQLSYYPEYNPSFTVKWVSREYGDGYGYDVLSYNAETRCEKLIEVKSGISERIILTENEFKTIYETKNFLNCDYFIYKYHYDKTKNRIELYKLLFDKENDLFFDIKHPDNIYHICPYFYYDGNSQKINAELVSEEKYEKILRR